MNWWQSDHYNLIFDFFFNEIVNGICVLIRFCKHYSKTEQARPLARYHGPLGQQGSVCEVHFPTVFPALPGLR